MTTDQADPTNGADGGARAEAALDKLLSDPEVDIRVKFESLFAPEKNSDGTSKTDYTQFVLPNGPDDDGENLEPDPVKQLSEDEIMAEPISQSSARLSVNGKPVFVVPSGSVTDKECAEVFCLELAKTRKVYVQGHRIVKLVRTSEGEYRLVKATPSMLRSLINEIGPIYRWHSNGQSQPHLDLARLSEEMAKMILASDAALRFLPPIARLAHCEILTTAGDGSLTVLGNGYHEHGGGTLVVGAHKTWELPLKVGLRTIVYSHRDFRFQTACDLSRALANAITPAMIMGGFIRGHAPIDFAEAPPTDSQSGKTMRQKVVAAIINEVLYDIPKKERGVGGLDESIAQGMASGRLCIQIDNLRPPFDSQYLESALTADRITARIPYHAELEVDPKRHFFFITTNVREFSDGNPLATLDLMRRSSLVRIRKQPLDFNFDQYPTGNIVDHIRAHQGFYLSCVFAVIREWHARGRQRTDERRHSFRDWAQIMDWIVQNLFYALPLFADHDDKGNPIPVLPNQDTPFIDTDDFFIDADSPLNI